MDENPYTTATPLDQILTALQIWRNMDHADNIKLSRHDVITIIEGVRAMRVEHWQLKGALGYEVPSDIPNGDFKCGLCDARRQEMTETPLKSQ